jgi:hypothetical protein
LNELNTKILIVENEMDIRVESLVSEIHKYREEFKQKLDRYKTNIEK